MCIHTDIHEWMESPKRVGFVCAGNAADLGRGQQALGQKLSAACRWETKLMKLAQSLWLKYKHTHILAPVSNTSLDFLCFGSRYRPWARGCRRDRGHQATVRHLGNNCEPGQSHGQHRCEWTHPSAWGHSEDTGRVGLCFRVARRDFCQRGEWFVTVNFFSFFFLFVFLVDFWFLLYLK